MNQNQPSHNDTLKEVPPPLSERIYKFWNRYGPGEKDFQIVEVPESELTHEQAAMLANEMWRAFMGMPGVSQDMFLEQVDRMINEARARMESAEQKPGGKIIGPDGLPADYTGLSVVKAEA